MPSAWERHPSGITFRSAPGNRPGEILYQVDDSSGQWLSKSEFDALTSRVPRTPYPIRPGPRPQDFRLFPSDNSVQTEANAGRVTGSFGDEVSQHFEHGPRNAGEQGRHDPARITRTYIDEQGRAICPANSTTRRTSATVSGGQQDSHQPRLTPLSRAFAQLESTDLDGLGQFVLKNPGILAQPEIDSFLSEAAYAQRAGKEALAQKYIHHAVLLRKCSKRRPEALEPLFQSLATRGETAEDLFADVEKVYNAVKSQYPAPQPPGQGQAIQNVRTAGQVRDRESQIIQGRMQSEVIPAQSVDRVNKLPARPQARDREGRLVYVDSQGHEVRPATTQGTPRGRHETELGPPTPRMADMKIVEPRDSSGNETSAQTYGKDPPSASLKTEKTIERPIGPQGGVHQRRRKYTIEGTAGDREALDADYTKRRKPEDFFTRGRVFALLWHQSRTGKRPAFDLSKEFRVTRGLFDEEIHSSIRRMVVVKEGRGHCWCLMIYTYGEQGVLKSGLSANDRKGHAVIHMTGERPANLQDEHLMNKEPIAVDPASPDQKLNKWSRLDFRRVHTVEHNVKVKNIGQVSKGSMPYLMTYFRDVVNEA